MIATLEQAEKQIDQAVAALQQAARATRVTPRASRSAWPSLTLGNLPRLSGSFRSRAAASRANSVAEGHRKVARAVPPGHLPYNEAKSSPKEKKADLRHHHGEEHEADQDRGDDPEPEADRGR